MLEVNLQFTVCFINYKVIILHPICFIYLISLIIFIFIVVSRDTLLIVWVALEINLIRFIPLIIKKNNKYQRERALKYFLVQAISSLILLVGLFELKLNLTYCYMFLLISLMLKVAAAPLHQWLPSIINRINWFSSFLIFRPQKLGPLMIIFLLLMNIQALEESKSLTTMEII